LRDECGIDGVGRVCVKGAHIARQVAQFRQIREPKKIGKTGKARLFPLYSGGKLVKLAGEP
jgi:hypothetical protein